MFGSALANAAAFDKKAWLPEQSRQAVHCLQGERVKVQNAQTRVHERPRRSKPEFLKENGKMASCLDVERFYIARAGSPQALALSPLIQIGPSPISAKTACYNRVESSEGVRFVSYHFGGRPELTRQFDDATAAIKLLTESERTEPAVRPRVRAGEISSGLIRGRRLFRIRDLDNTG